MQQKGEPNRKGKKKSLVSSTRGNGRIFSTRQVQIEPLNNASGPSVALSSFHRPHYFYLFYLNLGQLLAFHLLLLFFHAHRDARQGGTRSRLPVLSPIYGLVRPPAHRGFPFQTHPILNAPNPLAGGDRRRVLVILCTRLLRLEAGSIQFANTGNCLYFANTTAGISGLLVYLLRVAFPDTLFGVFSVFLRGIVCNFCGFSWHTGGDRQPVNSLASTVELKPASGTSV